MSDRNNPNTIEGIREHIRAIALAPTREQADWQHAYREGWIGALYWADVIDRHVLAELKAELDASVRAWEPPKRSVQV